MTNRYIRALNSVLTRGLFTAHSQRSITSAKYAFGASTRAEEPLGSKPQQTYNDTLHGNGQLGRVYGFLQCITETFGRNYSAHTIAKGLFEHPLY